MLYLRASQVVLFLQMSSNMVPFGANMAPQPDSQPAQTQSIPQSPTKGLQPWEDILRGADLGPGNTKRNHFSKLQHSDSHLNLEKRLFLHPMQNKFPNATCGRKVLKFPLQLSPPLQDPAGFLHDPNSPNQKGSSSEKKN